MFNRKQNDHSLPLTIYNDGIGFKNYTLRLRNFSLNNIPTNCARFAIWSVGIGVAMGKMIGLTSTDERTHYVLSAPPLQSNMIIDAITQGMCDVIYDPVIANDQYTYERSAIETWLNGQKKRSPINPSIIIDSQLIRPNDELKKKIDVFVNTLVTHHVANNANHYTQVGSR